MMLFSAGNFSLCSVVNEYQLVPLVCLVSQECGALVICCFIPPLKVFSTQSYNKLVHVKITTMSNRAVILNLVSPFLA